MKDAFEIYIRTCMTEEIDGSPNINRSFGKGGFWVAVDGQKIVGMFGLEPSGEGAMELRRMYLHPDFRRAMGIARRMLNFADQRMTAT